MPDIIAAVGGTLSEPAVVDVLESISPLRVHEDPPFRRYVGSPPNGIDLLFENERLIAVQIYVRGTGAFSAYSGELPLGLHGSDSQTEVHRVLGEPNQPTSISDKYAFPDIGVKLVITYDDVKNVRLLSFSSIK